MTVIEERATQPIVLKHGSHSTPEAGMCLLEATAWLAGEPHSDHPACACPVLAAFGRSWNDSIQDDARRTELLGPFAAKLVGTKSTREVELARSWMAFDWLVRVHTVAWLRLAGLTDHADALVALGPIDSREKLDASDEIRRAAWDAAWAAAGDAAGDAAWAAAGAAAGDAAGDAAWAAAGDAAGDAAWAAAGAAAGDAAGDAAGAAAGAAAWAALAPTVLALQESAVDLYDRMIRVGEP